MKPSLWNPWFLENGALQEMGKGERLPSSKKWFFIESGTFALFKEGELSGVFSSGKILFPFSGTFECEEAARVWSAAPELCERFAIDSSETGEELADLFDAWALQILRKIDSYAPPLHEKGTPFARKLRAKGPLFLTFQGSPLFQSQKLPWLIAEEGSLSLFSEFSIPPRSPFPLTPALWFHAEGTLQAEGVDTKTVIRRGLFPRALASFQDFLDRYFLLGLAEDKRSEKKRKKARRKEEEENVAAALERMQEAALQKKLTAKKRKDPLENALEALGEAAGLRFSFPSQYPLYANTEAKLLSIAETSRIRMRKISLFPGWSKEDLGPFLGFTEKNPAAFFRTSSYRMVSAKGEEKFSEKEVLSTAYMFYLPLPRKIELRGKFFFSLLKRYGKTLSLAALFGALGALFSFAPALATNLLFAYAIPERLFSLLSYLGLGLLFAAFGSALFSYLRDFLLLRTEALASHFFVAGVWDRLLHLSPGFFRKFTVGRLFFHITSLEEIGKQIGQEMARKIFGGVFSLFFLFVMFYFSPPLAWTTLAFVAFGLLLAWFSAVKSEKLMQEQMHVEGKVRAAVIQVLSGIDKLRVAGAERSAFANWASLYALHSSLLHRVFRAGRWLDIYGTVAPTFAFFGLYWRLLFLGPDEITLPHFLAFNTAFGSFCMGYFPLHALAPQIAQARALWKNVKGILEEPLEETGAGMEKKTSPGTLSGKIEIEELVFGYEEKQPPLLKGISLSIEPHSFVALVGRSGAGKSTLLRLLLGFETPTQGTIYYDGKDLAKLDPREVRQQIGVVLQHPSLFQGSILDNIRCGRFTSKAEVEKALFLSDFFKDVEEMPMGLQTIVSMGGTNLSGGQKQRLLLARALLTSPHLLLFDEATSALDNETQERIAKNIEELHATRIVIAQRLSTIRKADRIYVLEEGQIVQQGTYEELARKPGLFAEMIARQRS